MKELGPLSYFLGMYVTHNDTGLFCRKKSKQKKSLIEPACQTAVLVQHLLTLRLNMAQMILPMRIRPSIENLQEHYNILHSPDHISLVQSSKFISGCMIKKLNI